MTFSLQKAIFTINKKLCHLFHIGPIWLKLDRSITDLPGRKLYYKEHRTAYQFTAYQKFHGEKVTGGQYVPMSVFQRRLCGNNNCTPHATTLRRMPGLSRTRTRLLRSFAA